MPCEDPREEMNNISMRPDGGSVAEEGGLPAPPAPGEMPTGGVRSPAGTQHRPEEVLQG